MEKSRTTLDQWITLQAVVDYGGLLRQQMPYIEHNHQLAIQSIN